MERLAGTHFATLLRAFPGAVVVHCVLLLALLLGALVPQGMMNVAAADGMRLVLCTTEGAREMILTPEGEIREIPVGHETSSAGSSCLAVGLSLAGVQDITIPAPRPAEFAPIEIAVLPDVAPHEAPQRAFISRAPPSLS